MLKHQRKIITERKNKEGKDEHHRTEEVVTVCSRSEGRPEGLGRLGVKPPLKLKLKGGRGARKLLPYVS